MFVRHCASLSTSIIRGGSRGRRETSARVRVCVCIDGTCIITLKDKRGCSHREGWKGRGNVTGSTPAGTSIHQHTVASGTNWSLLNCKPRLPSMCLCLPLPPTPSSLSAPLQPSHCLLAAPHSLSLASLPSIQRCRTRLLVRRLPQGR